MQLKHLLLLFLCSLSLTAVADDYKIYSDDISATKGTSTSVLNVFMTNEETISALQFDITFPVGVDVFYGENEDEDMVYFISKGDRAKTDHTASYNKLSDRTYRVMVSSPTNATFKETAANRTKPIAVITLDVAAGAQCGIKNVAISNVVLSHYDAETRVTQPYYPDNTTSTIAIKPVSGAESNEADGILSIATADGAKLDAASYISLTSGKSDAVIDLRASEFSDGVTASDIQSAGASLYYLPKESSIVGKNIIVDGVCSELCLQDGKDLLIPVDFTAANASYSRAMDTTWGTICLPYAVASDESAAYYEITGIENGALTLTKYDELPAGTPALVKKLSGSEIAPQATTVAVNGALNNVTGSVKMYGSYTNKVRVENPNSYYIYNNKFYSCNQYFFCNAFRAYFVVENAAAKVLNIADDDDVVTAIDALTGEGNGINVEAIYGEDGIQRNDIEKGINIVKFTNGKTQKIIIK